MKQTPLVLLALLGWTAIVLLIGLYFGREHAWSYLDYATVERRMREVYCEQSVRNGVLKTCSADFPRAASF